MMFDFGIRGVTPAWDFLPFHGKDRRAEGARVRVFVAALDDGTFWCVTPWGRPQKVTSIQETRAA